MYDDLLGKRQESKKEETKKPRLRVNLIGDDSAKPADPDKFPSHESARNHKISNTDHCDCDGDCEGHQDNCPDGGGADCGDDCNNPPTPKDPWADVDEEEFDIGRLMEEIEEMEDPDSSIYDTDLLDDCDGHCENCEDRDFCGDWNLGPEPSQDIGQMK